MSRDRTHTFDVASQTSDYSGPQPASQPQATPAQIHPAHMLQRTVGNHLLQRVTQGDNTPPPGAATQTALNTSKGSALPSPLRHNMERAFGTDLGAVRTHTDPPAARAAQELNAKAFTHSNDIYFGAGQYQPQSPQGRHLIAHELAHTTQPQPNHPQASSLTVTQPSDPSERQAEAIATAISHGYPLPARSSTALHQGQLARQEDATAPAAPVAPDTTPDAPAGVPADEISLTSSTFEPTAAIATYLEGQDREGGDVRVRLGNLAIGTIPVRKSRDSYLTPGRNPKPVPLTHPALQPLRDAGVNPVLAVQIRNSAISGYITLARNEEVAGNPADLVNWIKDHSQEMGWLGLDVSRIPRSENELSDGTLRLQLTEFPVTIGGFVSGEASFGLENEAVTFSASGTIQVPQLTEAQVEINRDAEGNLSGSTEIPVEIANFSGNLIVQFRNGILDIRGTVGYQAEKFNGEVTLLVTDRNTARNVASQELPPEAIAASAEAASGAGEEGPQPGPRALAGFGTLDFAFTEWMTGRAQVIIDNEGHITVVGEIAPPAEIELFPQRDYIYDLFTVEVRTLYGVPLVGNVFLFANIGMQALAKLGPGKIYNIAIRGRYSTDPNVLQNFEMEATLNISAFAGLRLRGEGGAGVELLGHDIKAGVGINALAGIRGYVEATPVIGYRETADPQEGRQGEYFFRGHMEIAAQPFLGLGGDLFVELDSPWWSPAPDERWTWPLGELEYPLPGEFGVGADVDYVIGSDELPEIKMGEVDFDSSKFMTDLMNDHVPPAQSSDEERQGEWQEDQTTGEAAEPTVPSGGGGGATDQPAQGQQSGDRGEVPSSPDVMQRWGRGMEALGNLARQSQRDPLNQEEINTALARIRRQYGFRELRATRSGEDWLVHARMNPETGDNPIAVEGEDSEEVNSPEDDATASDETSASTTSNAPASLNPGTKVEVLQGDNWLIGDFVRYRQLSGETLMEAMVRNPRRRRTDSISVPNRLFGQRWRLRVPGPVSAGTTPVPVVRYSSSAMPNISTNIRNAIQNGKDDRLHRLTGRSRINANRTAALSGLPPAGPGMSWDEYPFASSYEGGANSEVMAVPETEQDRQGGLMSSFYQNNNINDGDEYKVEVV